MKGSMSLMPLLFVIVLGCATAGETPPRGLLFAGLSQEAISQGRYVEAEHYLNEALARNPDDPGSLLNLGVVYHNTRRPQQARALYERVIRLNPTQIVVRGPAGGMGGKSLVDLARENLQRL